MENKNILSIDLDYIMEPCIEDYEKLIRRDTPKYISSIDGMESIFDRNHYFADQINKFAEASLENVNEIVEIFVEALVTRHKKTIVYFASNHDSILNPLQKILTKKTKVNLLNIDHHHDIYYSQDQKRAIDAHDLVSPADWVWFLDKNNLINTYSWIGNKNSQVRMEKFKNLPFIKFTSLKECRAHFTTWPEHFDLIYVCCSPHWTPAKFLKYFDMLKTIAEKITGKKYKVDHGHYCGERAPKPFFGYK